MTYQGLRRRTNYDQASGQIFTEVSVPAGVLLDASTSKGPAWVHDSPLLPLGVKNCPGVGVNSLKDMALYQLLSDQRLLTPAHFEQVPWPVAKYVFDFVIQRQASQCQGFFTSWIITVFP